MGIQKPLYYQVEEDLRKRIRNGEFKEGDLFPSERELIETYKVSRLTIRRAVDNLVEQGLLEKKQGKGTFVTRPKINHRVGSLYSSSEEFLLNNYIVKTKVIECKKTLPDNEVCEKLRFSNCKEEIFYLERIRYANEIPAAYIKCYLPYRFVPGIEKIDFTNNYLYKTLEDVYKLELYEAYEIIEATLVDETGAKYLGLKEGAPVLLNQRVTYLSDGQIIEYEKILYRSDIFKYHNRLIGRGHGPSIKAPEESRSE